VITDLGYNLSSDGTCGFTQTTSRQNVAAADLGLADGVANLGGPVPTLATLWSSEAVDYILAGATYGPDNTPLCPTTPSADVTDVRGVARPQGDACDAGSMELIATHTTMQAPASARPHTATELDAAVTGDAPVPGTDPSPITDGTVTFVSGSKVLCADVAVANGVASCQTTSIGAGQRTVTATFTPAATSALHASTSQPQAIVVASAPSFTSPRTSRFVVGKPHTFHIHASGAPRPRLSRIKGSLPAGLHFTGGLGSATIKGTAKRSAAGSYTIKIQAHNLKGVVDQVLRIMVTRH